MAPEHETNRMKTLCLQYGSNLLKISSLRYLAQYAHTIGIQPYGDDNFRGYIHPVAAGDVLNDCTFDGLVDVIYLDKAPDTKFSDTMRLAGIRFRQTITVSGVYLFGANSDPFDVQYLYLESDGKYSIIRDNFGKQI